MDKYDEQLTRHRAGVRAAYYRRKAAGICVFCRKRPAEPGRTHCEACRLEIMRRAHERLAEAKAQGVCPRCQKPYVGKWRMCMACRIKDAEAQKERKPKREERKNEKDHD